MCALVTGVQTCALPISGLAGRDRRVLQVGVLLVVLMLIWSLGWQTLARARASLRAQAIAQAPALAWLRPAAKQLAASGGLSHAPSRERKRVVWGKSVAVRGVLGGRRTIKKKLHT